jgi:hypothetical protein
VDPLPSLLAEGVNRGNIPVYSTTTVTVLITNLRGKQEAQEVPFVVTDLRRYPVYLSLPWIDAYQPRLNYATRRLLFRGNKVLERGRFQKVAAEGAAEFDRTM